MRTAPLGSLSQRRNHFNVHGSVPPILMRIAGPRCAPHSDCGQVVGKRGACLICESAQVRLFSFLPEVRLPVRRERRPGVRRTHGSRLAQQITHQRPVRQWCVTPLNLLVLRTLFGTVLDGTREQHGTHAPSSGTALGGRAARPLAARHRRSRRIDDGGQRRNDEV